MKEYNSSLIGLKVLFILNIAAIVFYLLIFINCLTDEKSNELSDIIFYIIFLLLSVVSCIVIYFDYKETKRKYCDLGCIEILNQNPCKMDFRELPDKERKTENAVN